MIGVRIASVKQEVDIDALTHCGQVMAYADIDLGIYADIDLSLHWLRQWLVTWWLQAITQTNVD